MAFEPKLPEGVSLPDGFRVDVNDGRYKALHDLAEREKWSQKAFSDVLGIEARRVSAEHVRARAAQPAPARRTRRAGRLLEDEHEPGDYALANPKRG